MASIEKCMDKTFSLDSIIKQHMHEGLRFDYATQREMGRWNYQDKSEEMSDILHNHRLPQIVFCEQIMIIETKKMRWVWVIDGKQRLTNAIDYVHDKFKIAKNVKLKTVTYIDCGEEKEFEIAGKKYSQLPEPLQQRIKDYTFSVQFYMDCTSDEIEYHYERYNRGTRLNKTEKGLANLGCDKTSMLRQISGGSFFSIDNPNYTKADRKNSGVLKAIAYSIMAVFFQRDWNERIERVCDFLKPNLTQKITNEFDTIASELDNCISDKARKYFTSSLSFLYFSGVKTAKKLGKTIEEYAEFLDALASSLHSTKLQREAEVINEDGTIAMGTVEESWDDLLADRKHNTQTGVFNARIVFMERLMRQYFNISDDFVPEEENVDIDESAIVGTEDAVAEMGLSKSVNTTDFIKDLFGEEEAEAVEVYEDALNDYLDREVNQTIPACKEENHPSMVAIVCYAWSCEADPVNWFASYFKENPDYIADQKENYEAMKRSFDQYYSLKKIA